MDLFTSSAVDGAWSVTRVARATRRAVEQLGSIWVRGELTSLKVYQSGHWYFTLRDAESQLKCVMWRTYSQRIRPRPEEGIEVFVLAAPTVWEERGEFRLNVTNLLPTAAVGGAQQEYERVKARLEKDGLFDPDRKRPLPRLATRIAVVTSLDGAALRDIITVTRKRWPAVELLVVGARVQGDDAEPQLVRALATVNRLPGIHLCIVGRGGGGREDLAVFNREAVCRALAAVRVPTIAAVGHETDVSLCDFVADVRAATPSAAAEIAVADASELERQVNALGSRLAHGLSRRSRLASERLLRTADRLQGAVDGLLERRGSALERLGLQLDALSPLRVLDRGYSVAHGPDGRLLRRRADFVPGQPFNLRVSDGTVDARVESS